MSRFILVLALLSVFTVLAYSQNCSVAQDCTRTSLNPTNPTQYVQCNNGQCACGGSGNCFEMNTGASVSEDACTLDDRCFTYTNLGQCESTAREWLTAVLLQAFVGGVGAANFYIGRNDLAGGQLFLFLALLILPCCLSCASCATKAACSSGGDDNTVRTLCGCTIIIIIIFLVIVILIATFMAPIWWIADLIIIALNQRRDLNGCMLNQP